MRTITQCELRRRLVVFERRSALPEHKHGTQLPVAGSTTRLFPQPLIYVAETCYYNTRVREAGVRPVMLWKDDVVFPAIARSPDITTLEA